MSAFGACHLQIYGSYQNRHHALVSWQIKHSTQNAKFWLIFSQQGCVLNVLIQAFLIFLLFKIMQGQIISGLLWGPRRVHAESRHSTPPFSNITLQIPLSRVRASTTFIWISFDVISLKYLLHLIQNFVFYPLMGQGWIKVIVARKKGGSN